MKRILLVLVGLTLMVAVRARAEETVKETLKPYTPRAGLWEFELDGPAFPLGQINFVAPGNTAAGINAQPQRGFTVSNNTGTGGGTTTGFGLAGSFGNCVSDLIEIGASLGVNYSSLSIPNLFGSGSSTLNLTTFNLGPFLKLNFGGTMAPDSQLNPFLLVGAGINYTSESEGSSSTDATYIVPELAPGVELMVNRYWGISLYVPITIAFNVTPGAPDNKVIGFGLAYGLVAYFDGPAKGPAATSAPGPAREGDPPGGG